MPEGLKHTQVTNRGTRYLTKSRRAQMTAAEQQAIADERRTRRNEKRKADRARNRQSPDSRTERDAAYRRKLSDAAHRRWGTTRDAPARIPLNGHDPENPKVGDITQGGAKVVAVSKHSCTIRGQ